MHFFLSLFLRIVVSSLVWSYFACLHSCIIYLSNVVYLAMSLYCVLYFVPSFVLCPPSSIAVCVDSSCCHICSAYFEDLLFDCPFTGLLVCPTFSR